MQTTTYTFIELGARGLFLQCHMFYLHKLLLQLFQHSQNGAVSLACMAKDINNITGWSASASVQLHSMKFAVLQALKLSSAAADLEGFVHEQVAPW